MLSLLGDKATNSYMLALLSELSKQEITAHPQSKAANLAIAVTQYHTVIMPGMLY